MTRTPFITEIIRHLVDHEITEANAGTMVLAHSDLIKRTEKSGASAKFAAIQILMLLVVGAL